MSRRDKVDRRRDQEAVRQGQQTPTSVHVQQTTVQQKIRSGPLPDPAELQQYKDVDPELYVAIRDEFLANGAHRRQMEGEESRRMNTLVHEGIKIERISLAGATLFTFSALIVGGVAMFTGHSVGGLVALLGIVPGILVVLRASGKGRK